MAGIFLKTPAMMGRATYLLALMGVLLALVPVLSRAIKSFNKGFRIVEERTFFLIVSVANFLLR